MAVQTLKIAAGNTAPPWAITCQRKGKAIDLTNCSVAVIVARGTTITNTGFQSALVTAATSGLISYSPRTTDCPTAGSYKCDVKVTYGDGTFEVLYDQLRIKARKTLQ